MSDGGIKIEWKNGVHFLSGELNEYADFSPLTNAQSPLVLNLKELSRLNSIGIRNLLKFLNTWGSQPLEFQECRSEFIDQVNMIPALLGVKGHAEITSLFVPFECDDCGHEEEVFGKTDDFEGDDPIRECPSCGGEMCTVSDSYFVFRSR